MRNKPKAMHSTACTRLFDRTRSKIFSIRQLLSLGARNARILVPAVVPPPSLRCEPIGTISYGHHVKARAQNQAHRMGLENNRLNRG